MLVALIGWSYLQLATVLDDPRLAGATVAVSVADGDQTVFERNASLRVVPASNQKLFTAAFALYELGPDFRPTTRFWRNPDRVVVESAGDPLLTHLQLLAVRQKLGMPRLPVYVRQSYAPGIPSGWDHDDLKDRFAAAVSAFSFDQGAFESWNEMGRARLLPEPFGVRIVPSNEVKAPGDYDPFRRRLTVPKKLPRERQRLDTLALPDPAEAAAALLGGELRAVAELPTRIPDAVIEGEPAAEMVKRCLQPSDNNMAENLLLMGSLHLGETPGDPYPAARDRLSKFLERVVGTAPEDVLPSDGSGLGRQNLATARSVVALLRWANRQPTASIWRASLASPGVGTLRSRLKDVLFKGKTGSLHHVSALSGYLTAANGRELTVSVILNNYRCPDAEARQLIDQFITILSRAAPNGIQLAP